jgi:signal transduction histidine kinase
VGRLKDRVPGKKSYFPYAVVIGLGAILATLAWVQYRWSDQVGQAERDRIEASLRIATTQFRQEFVRDLQTLASGLQPEPEFVSSKDWNSYAIQSVDFLKTATYPDLAAGVYLWHLDGGLLELNRNTKQFEPASEPAALAPLLVRFKAQAEGNRQGRGRQMFWQMDGSVPALSHAMVVYRDPDDRRPPQPPTLVGYVVILLNREFIQTKFLPELATRHFGGPDGLLYQVGVFIGPGAEHVVYQSGPGIDSKNIKSADAAIELIDSRPRLPGPMGGGQPRGPGQGPGPGSGPSPGPGPEDQRPPGPPNGQGRGPFNFQERLRQTRRFGAAAPAPPIVADARSTWSLVVRHRAGSVDAAVAGLRTRNLAISFAILLLLGASMALIILTTQRAQRLARLQVDFVAGVSHELRTPLAVIASAADNLTVGIVEDKTQVKLYGSLIRNEARRLEGMMEQILAFAAGRNRRTYEPQLLSVEELIDRAISLCSASIQEAQFQIEKHVASDLSPILAEENGILQCLQNLINNAVKYGGPGRWVGIDARMDGPSVLISVADRGLGIETGDLPYVFDAFYRGKSALDAQIHGTGLGLNLARSFVQAAGGTISVKSTVGEGSCFTVRLPAAKPALAGGPEALAGQIA